MDRHSAVRPKFIIHLDINGTIMPADPIKSKHVRTMLNIHLSKQAFVRRQSDTDRTDASMVWWDGSPFQKGGRPPLLPQFRYTCHIQNHYNEALPAHHHSYPVSESVSLEDFNAVCDGDRCDDFTSRHLPGHVYEPELERLLKGLEWKHEDTVDASITDTLTLPIIDGRRMNLFVPSFLRLLKHLNEQDSEYVLVIRTFGSDIPRIIPAFSLIAKGQHPDLPISGCISEPSASGFLSRVGDEFNLDLQSVDGEVKSTVEGNAAILDYFESLPSKSVIMLNDDYDMWRDHSFSPLFGKPVFLDLTRIDSVRHFLFDDNVNMNPHDSIACVWLRPENTESFTPLPLSSQAGLATIGTVLLQASLYNSIVNPDAFVMELQHADKRYQTLVSRLEGLRLSPDHLYTHG